MISLLVAFILYEGNADWYWWAVYGIILFMEFGAMVLRIKEEFREEL